MKTETRYNKENDIDTEIVKEAEDKTRNYLFQKDKITKRSFLFVTAIILLLIIAVAVTAVFLE